MNLEFIAFLKIKDRLYFPKRLAFVN